MLLDDDSTRCPAVVAEGRRVIANIERVANLFVTKTVYAALLALAVGVAGLTFPFYPRHLTLVSSLTIGSRPSSSRSAPAARARSGNFVGRVVRFTAPAGFVAAGADVHRVCGGDVGREHDGGAGPHHRDHRAVLGRRLGARGAGPAVDAVAASDGGVGRHRVSRRRCSSPASRDVLAMQLPPLGVGLAVVVVGLAARPLLHGALHVARWAPYDAVP